MLAGVADHHLTTGTEPGAQFAADPMAVQLVEFFVDTELEIEGFVGEAVGELLSFSFDLMTDIGVQREHIAAYLHAHR